MKKRLRLLTPLTRSIIALLFTLCGSQAARGLGLGDIKAESALNEPLVAKIELLNASALSNRDLIVAIGSKEDYRIVGVERDYFHTDLTLEAYIEGQGTPYISITSTKPVLEPFVNFVVQIRWPQGKLLREYTILLDLPVFTGRSQQQQLEAPKTASKSELQRDDERSPRSSTPKSVKTSGPAAKVGGEYLVKNGDTLWSMARSIASDTGTTRQQAMLAIRDGNPNAFMNGNPNALKSGVVLRMPDQNQAGRRSASDAAVEFSNLQKRSGRALEATPVRSSSNNFREQQSGSTSSAGRLALTSSAALGAGSQATEAESSAVGGLTNENAALKEELDRVGVENNDLRERLSALEEQLEVQLEIVALLTVEDNGLAATQESLGAASALANEPAVTTAAETTGGATDPEAEPSLTESLMGFLSYIGAGLVVLLLVVMMVLKRRKASTGKDDDLLSDDLEDGMESMDEFFANDDDEFGSDGAVNEESSTRVPSSEVDGTDEGDEEDIDLEGALEDLNEFADLDAFFDSDDIEDFYPDAAEENSIDDPVGGEASKEDTFSETVIANAEDLEAEGSEEIQRDSGDNSNEMDFESFELSEEDDNADESLGDLHDEEHSMDFDDGIELPEVEEDTPATEEDPENTMTFDLDDLDLPGEETAATDDDLSGLDLDLGDSDEDDVSDLTGGLEDDMDELLAAFSGQEDDQDDGSADQETDDGFDLSDVDPGDELGEGLDLLADFGDDVEDLEEEMSTKLELAEAYVEMVDIRGAKELLNEILADGNDAQKEAAQKLSERIEGLG